MKVAIDCRMINESGIGRYIKNLIGQLQKLDLENEYFLLLRDPEYRSLNFQKNFHKVLADFRWYSLAEQVKMPKILNELDLDLVHFPHFNVPLFFRGKFIVTIHDLIHQHFQMRRSTTHDPITYKIKQLSYNKVFKNAINKSSKILVPSNYVKNLLIKEWNVLDEKIVVTYEAVDDKLFSIANNLSQVTIKKILDKFDVHIPYLFYVGNAHPHKNLEGLIKAFLNLRQKHPDLSLVLSGEDHYFWKRLKKEYQRGGIIYTGFLTDEELVVFYRAASCFVMPSFEEGFGIPLLEAMACRCPVISSNTSSLPEIGKDGAIYFDPQDVEDMSSKISQMLDNQFLRKNLIEKGKKRVGLFSWETLAKQTLKGYQQCVLQ